MKNRHLILIVLLFLTKFLFGQTQGYVKNAITLEPLEFVNICIENSNDGTSSNELGFFSLSTINNDSILVFSAVGFETQKINSAKIIDSVYLKPIVEELNEIELTTKKNNKEFKIGSFEKSNIELYFGADAKYPWIIARLYKYNEVYNETQYLKKIKLVTSISEKTEFNIRIYTVGIDGKPDEYLAYNNIIGIAKKGINETEIDISQLNIIFPENGLFIAVENIKKHQEKKKNKSSKLEKTFSVGLDLNLKNETTYIYYKGNWVDKIKSKKIFSDKMLNLFKAIPIELTLSD